MYARDVVVQTNANVFPLPNPLFESTPPLPDRFEIGEGLWIGKIENEAAKTIFDLNEPFYHGTPKPVIQFAQQRAYRKGRFEAVATSNQSGALVSRIRHTDILR